MHYRYPFIYGQPDTRQFPLATWRSAANWLHGGVRDPAWVIDHIDQDVPMLIEQIRTRVLPSGALSPRRMKFSSPLARKMPSTC